jgi:hypothetical protein
MCLAMPGAVAGQCQRRSDGLPSLPSLLRGWVAKRQDSTSSSIIPTTDLRNGAGFVGLGTLELGRQDIAVRLESLTYKLAAFFHGL